jgi:Protein of unknown function (DUF3489)
MPKSQRSSRAKPAAPADENPIAPPPAKRAATRADTLIALMSAEGGATAAELGAAVGWQVHSVRGFIAGNLKKRSDLTVTAVKQDGATHYRILDAAAVTP